MKNFVLTLLLITLHTYSFAQGVEDTKTNKAVESQVIEHTGYRVSYNQTWCIPNWVAYELTRSEVAGQYPRRGSFCPDPQVVGYTAVTSDYTKSGWDRGHMAPAADMKWSEEVMLESFYLSNICPQNSGLNGGLWLSLEERARYWANKDSNIFIVCGPIMDDVYDTIGANGVAVPKGFFKVICKKNKGTYVGIGFIFPNENCSGDIFDLACTIDKVEEISGHDFFYILPDNVENTIERSFNLKDWN
jgi:endonuclease G